MEAKHGDHRKDLSRIAHPIIQVHQPACVHKYEVALHASFVCKRSAFRVFYIYMHTNFCSEYYCLLLRA